MTQSASARPLSASKAGAVSSVLETEVRGILRRDLDERIKRSGLQFLGTAGLGAGMEMMDESARRQKERIFGASSALFPAHQKGALLSRSAILRASVVTNSICIRSFK
jgi:hypothetical protein